MSEAGDKIKAAMDAHGVAIRAEFVPFSKSRNVAPKDGKPWQSLNWKITISKGGRDVLKTDYSAGVGHCPADKSKLPRYEKAQLVAWECENGFAGQMMYAGSHISAKRRPIAGEYPKMERAKLEPEIPSVMASLVLDARVIDSGTFEDWASEMGYEADSRAAETIYKACLEIGLKLRAGLGSDALAAITTACEDY